MGFREISKKMNTWFSRALFYLEWALYIFTLGRLDFRSLPPTLRFLDTLSRVSPTSSQDLVRFCKSALKILNLNLSPIDTSLMMIEKEASPFRRVLRFTAEGYEARVAHLKHNLKAALKAGVLVDIEGVRFGKLFGSADLVVLQKGTLVLIDFTSDFSLKKAKQKSLEETIAIMTTVHKGIRVRAEVLLVEEARKVPDEPLPRAEEYPVIFQAIDALSIEIIKKDISPEPYLTEVSSSISSVKREKEPLTEDMRAICMRVASGEEIEGDISSIVTHSGTSYPKMTMFLKKSFSRVERISKGMPPPASNAQPISSKGNTWAALLKKAKESKEGNFIHWEEGKPPWEEKSAQPATIRLHKTSKHYYKIDLDEGAPDEWNELINRKNRQSSREVIEPLSNLEFESMFKLATDFASQSYQEGATYLFGDLTTSAKIISDSTPTDFPHRVAKGFAKGLIDRITSSYGYAMMETSRTATTSACLASTAGKTGEFRIMEFAAGRIITIAKKTGDLNVNNDSTSLIAVSSPVGPELTWEASREEGISLSKAIFASARLRDHLDETLGNSVGVGCAYADGTSDISKGVEAAAMVCVSSVAANKNLGVVTSLERQLATGSCSIYNEVDKVAEKLDVFSPYTLIEGLIVSRIVVRSLACCLLRDEGSMKNIMRRDNEGAKTPIYCPCLVTSGIFNYTGLINSVYDYVIGSSQAASRVRNEAKALLGVFDEVKDYTERREAGDESLKCMSNLTFRHFIDGTLSDFVGTKEFETCEKEFISTHISSGKKHMASTTLMVSFANKYAKDCNMYDAVDKIVEDCSMIGIDKAISTKRATEVLNVATERAAEPAYRTVLLFLARLVGSPARAFIASSMIGVIFSRLMGGDTDLFSFALAATFLADPYYVICKAKDFTVEKTRDFFMMSANLRMAQCFHEQVSLRLSSLFEWSALTDGSKIAQLNKRLDQKARRGYYFMCFMTDKTRYGPTRIPGLLSGVIRASGVKGPAMELYKNSLAKMMRKRVRPADMFFQASEDEIRRADESVAPGILKKLIECMRSEDFSVEVASGTGQGLTQATSDVYTAISTGILEDILRRKYSRASCVSTNDDGASMVEVSAKEVWQAAEDIANIHILVGTITGECLNKSKVSASTWNVDLNTQFRQIGDTSNEDGACMPWAREICASSRPSNVADTTKSLYSAITQTNGAVDEAAPLFALYASTSVSLMCHYKRFRFAEKVMKGEYVGAKGCPFGKPIIAPVVVRAFGPRAVCTAYTSRETGRSIKTCVETGIVASVLSDCVQVGSLSWVDSEVQSKKVKAYTKYVFSTIPYARIMADKELKMIISKANEPGIFSKIRKGSLAELFLTRMAELSDFSSDDIVKSCGLTVGWAAASFAQESARVVALDIYTQSKNVKMVERKITISEMIEESKDSPPDLSIKGVESWGVTKAIIDQAETASFILFETPRQGRLHKGINRKVIGRLTGFPGTLSMEEESALLYQICPPDLKEDAAISALWKGVHVAPARVPRRRATLTETVRMKVAVKRISSLVYGRDPPPIVINRRVDTTSLSSYCISYALADVGLGYHVKDTNPLPVIAKPIAIQTPSQVATAIEAKRVTSMVVSKASILEYPPVLKRQSVVRNSSTIFNLALDEEAIDPAVLMPESARELSRMTPSLMTRATTAKSSIELTLSSAGTNTSGVLRRFSPNHALMRMGYVKLFYGESAVKVSATINRRFLDGVYMRNFTVMTARKEDPKMIKAKVDGSEREFTHVREGFWTCIYSHRSVRKEILLTTIRPGDSIELRPGAYPPALILRRKGENDFYVLKDAEEEVDISTNIDTRPAARKDANEEVDNKTVSAIERLADFLLNVPSLANGVASMGANMDPVPILAECIKSIASLDTAKVTSYTYFDMVEIATDIMESDNALAEIALLASLTIASISSKYTLITHSDSESADVYGLIRSHAYKHGHIEKPEAEENKETLEGKVFDYMDQIEFLEIILEEAKKGGDTAADMFSPEDGVENEDPRLREKDELGLTDNDDIRLMEEILGVSSAAKTAKIVSTLPFGSERLKRYLIGKGTEKVLIRHEKSITKAAEEMVIRAAKVTERIAKQSGISSSRFTSSDICNSFSGADSLYISRAAREEVLLATVVSHSRFRRFVEEKREEVSTKLEESREWSLIAPLGKYRTGKISWMEARRSGFYKTITSFQVEDAPTRAFKPGDYPSRMGIVKLNSIVD